MTISQIYHYIEFIEKNCSVQLQSYDRIMQRYTFTPEGRERWKKMMCSPSL